MRREILVFLAALAMVAGCGSSNSTGTDAGAGADAASVDASMALDSGPPPVDAARVDGGGETDAGSMPDAAMMPDASTPIDGFAITSLSGTGCTTVDHDAITGDDRGGLAVGDRVIVSGDDASAIYDLGLTTGTALARTGGLDGAFRQVLVNDVGSGTVYALADASGALPIESGGPIMLTRLLGVGADGAALAGTTVTLSTPIALDPSSASIGLFSGRGQIAIHDGTSLFIIAIPSGTVTEVGALAMPGVALCETWAYWGLLERAGATNSLVVVGDGTSTFLRVAVPSAATTTLATFTDLSDMCSFAASTATSRWYFHHESGSQFDATTNESLGYCTATYDTTGTDFTVTSLGSTGCSVIDAEALVGDDHGGVVVSGENVFLAGDDGLGRWALDLTGGIASGGRGIVLDALVTNVRDGSIWSLATETALLGADGGTVTRLVGLDPTTGAESGTVIALSRSIDVGSGTGIFSGWDEIALHDGTNVLLIALPSGTVTDLGAMPVPSLNECENWATWGVLENVGGERRLVGVDGAEVARYVVPTGVRSVVAAFKNLSDMCSISPSVATSRWYFHHESGSQLTTGDPEETLGFCPATYATP